MKNINEYRSDRFNMLKYAIHILEACYNCGSIYTEQNTSIEVFDIKSDRFEYILRCKKCGSRRPKRTSKPKYMLADEGYLKEFSIKVLNDG